MVQQVQRYLHFIFYSVHVEPFWWWLYCPRFLCLLYLLAIQYICFWCVYYLNTMWLIREEDTHSWVGWRQMFGCGFLGGTTGMKEEGQL